MNRGFSNRHLTHCWEEQERTDSECQELVRSLYVLLEPLVVSNQHQLSRKWAEDMVCYCSVHCAPLKRINYLSEVFKISGKMANAFFVNLNYFNIIKR